MTTKTTDEPPTTMSRPDPARPGDSGGQTRIVLATSNGTGMGHLARQAAVGLTLGGTVEPIMFSMSTALPIIAEHGMRGEYCPGPHRGWMPHPYWHAYLRDRIGALLAETGARVFVYDGVSPYIGLLRARTEHPDVAFCWVRRGMWRRGANEGALAARPFFDLVVEPSDLASDADVGATVGRDDVTRVGSITLVEPLEQLSREDAAAALGLDPSRPTALVTLGAGSINDVRTPAVAALRAFLAHPDWQVAMMRAPLAAEGRATESADRVRELVGVYPMARYLHAFDAAVSAAGYNAVHELLLSRIPTVLVPNESTSTDDQVSRARWASDVGLALYADQKADSVAAAATRLLDPMLRIRLSEICATLPPPTGASALAGLLTTLDSTFDHHLSSLYERLRAQDLALREAAMRGLGGPGTAVLRRALGRPQRAGPLRRLAVEPLVTERLDSAVLRGKHPVEHLLSGSSARYRSRRLEIARHCYRWPESTPSP